MNGLIIKTFLVSAVLFSAASLVSCDDNDSSNKSSDTGIVAEVYEEYPYYESLTKLSNKATGIFTGKIVGKEVLYINDKTGETALDKNETSNPDDYNLYTVYEIQPTEIFYGEFNKDNTIKVKIMGDGETVISHDAPALDIAEEYLFFINYYGSTPSSLLSNIQSIYKENNDRFEPISDKNNIEFSYNELKDITNK